MQEAEVEECEAARADIQEVAGATAGNWTVLVSRRGQNITSLAWQGQAQTREFKELCAIYLVVISDTELATLELEMLTSLEIRLGRSYLLSELIL